METTDSPKVEPHEVIALVHRLAVLRAIRKTTIAGFLIFLLLAITQRNWWFVPLSFVTAWITAVVMSNVSANKVQRITGMSHEYQAMIWERYKHDPDFAVMVHQAVKGSSDHAQT